MMKAEEKEAHLGKFLKWALELGISDSLARTSCLGHTLTVADFPQAGGRGLAAARMIRKGELILRVPKAALMTSDCLISRDPNFSTALGKYHHLLSSCQILSIALLNEVNKGRSSWWYPYLKQIPLSYDLLASFSRFEVEALQIDDGVWIAEKSSQNAHIEWKTATPLMSELCIKPQIRTFKAWLWASATISSRTMHIPWDTAGCLCPVGDFFNYAPPGEESPELESPENSPFDEERTDPIDNGSDRLIDAGYDESSASYCFHAKRNYMKGDQVLLSYGTYTNLELLEHYGFVLQGNPNDKVFIPLEPEMYSIGTYPKESLHISQDGKPSFALLSTIRLWAIPASKRKSIGQAAYSGNRISPENEVAVMEWLAMKCRVLLSSYSTSVEEDALLLCIIDKLQDHNHVSSFEHGELSPPLSSEVGAFLKHDSVVNGKVCSRIDISAKKRRSVDRWKLAVEWRYGHKTILCDCISHCEKILDSLS